MDAKPRDLVVAVMYALAEMRMGSAARDLSVGYHMQYGLFLSR